MRALFVAAFAIGCGGAPRATPAGPRAPQLLEAVGEEAWFRATVICGQGPYELELPVANARWGEELELRVATPRAIALHAVIIADDAEAAHASGVYAGAGAAAGADRADNTRCVANLRERAAARGGVIVGDGPPVPVGERVRTPDEPARPARPAIEPQLEIDHGAPPPSIAVLRYGWREAAGGVIGRRYGRIRVRLWSIEPNDLEHVRFGVRRIEWRPNVSDAAYEAHLAYLVERAAAQQRAAAARAEAEAAKRARKRKPAPPPAPRPPPIHTDGAAELAAYREKARAREVETAAHLAAERARDAYCVAHPDEARCWSRVERARREAIWRERRTIASAPPRQPDGPPPAPLADEQPPKLSEHAEWRPGYWHWTGHDWLWLGGMWRVPEADIVAERTTVAPGPPPPPRDEAIPPPPMPAAIWATGFWQWSGSGWVWVRGSWQLRPDGGAAWRPAEWRPRGAAHVLIPGGWIRIRTRRP